MPKYLCIADCFASFQHPLGRMYNDGVEYEFGPDVQVPLVHFAPLDADAPPPPTPEDELEFVVPNQAHQMEEEPKEDLTAMSIPQLKKRAKECKVKGWNFMKTKEKLIDKIEEKRGH